MTFDFVISRTDCNCTTLILKSSHRSKESCIVSFYNFLPSPPFNSHMMILLTPVPVVLGDLDGEGPLGLRGAVPGHRGTLSVTDVVQENRPASPPDHPYLKDDCPVRQRGDPAQLVGREVLLDGAGTGGDLPGEGETLAAPETWSFASGRGSRPF